MAPHQLHPDALWPDYESWIRSLPHSTTEFTQEELLVPESRIAVAGPLEVYWAPFESFNPHARVIIAGITPGWTQMELGIRRASEALVSGADVLSASRAAKTSGAFAGSMRRNLVGFLDDLGLPEFLEISTADELFGVHSDLVHTTSVLRYPVFNRGRNYSGSSPHPWKSELLWGFATRGFAAELNRIPGAVVIPLGKAVDGTLSRLVEAGLVPPGRHLRGFPHPSGLNGHRNRLFAERRDQLAADLRQAIH